MPLIGIKCKKHGNMDFGEIQKGKCDCTPRVIVDSILEIVMKDYHKGDVITATSCLGCIRETYLTRTYPYYATIAQLYYSWRGTLTHHIFERPKLVDWKSEEQFSKELDIDGKPVKLTGKIDGYDARSKALQDFKTIGDKGLMFVIKQGAKDDHIAQVNIYKWLCPYKVERLEIIYFSMMTFAKTGEMFEFSQSFKNDPDKTKHGFEYFEPPVRRTKSGWGKYKLFYNIPAVPIWSEDEVKKYLTPKVKILYNAFNNKIIPPMCDEETRGWKCNDYCNVKHLCDKIEKGEDLL